MTSVGSTYGEALYDLAKAESLSSEILEQISALAESFCQEPDFLRLLQTANLTKQERCQIVDDSFRGKLHPYVLNFLKILTEKGYVRHFSQCVEAYRQHYNLDNNILPVTAVTAVPLTEEQKAKLKDKLCKLTGKEIDLANKVDATIMGGVRLDYDGKRLEDTVAHRLESISALLKNTAL